jgi:Reverse transcriptase (RNA-dependent DNA polymerase)
MGRKFRLSCSASRNRIRVYGFRPGRGQHDALDALAYELGKRRINWVLDADIRSFFDTISHDRLIRFIEHRIGDRRVIRLIRKWLAAGVLEEGRRIAKESVERRGGTRENVDLGSYLGCVTRNRCSQVTTVISWFLACFRNLEF